MESATPPFSNPTNLPFLLGVNYWPSRQGVEMWRDWQPGAVASELKALAATGCRVVRFFLRWVDFQPEEDRIEPTALQRLRQFCDLAWDAGLGVIPTFFTGHMSGENWDVPWRRGRCPYTDPGMLRAQVRLVRAVAEAIGDHPALVAWDLANEPDIFARPPSADAGWLWCRLLYRELKAVTPAVPVTLGIHVTSLVDDCGFRPADVAEAADFLCMHLYPIYSPWCPDPAGTVRPNLLVPCGDRLVAAMGRKPALAEEFGSTTLMMSPELHGRYVSAVLGSLLLHGSLGAVAWCGLDFTCEEELPYDSTPYEVAFGILDAEGRPKPAGAAFARFARMLQRLPTGLRPAPRPAAILLPERYYDNADPDVTPERNFAVLFNAFVLARRAGLPVEFVRPDADWSAYRLLIAPCLPRRNSLSTRTWNRLRRWVEGGGTLYLSYDGVALPGMEEVFGIAIQDAYPREAVHGPGPWELVLDARSLDHPSPDEPAGAAAGRVEGYAAPNARREAGHAGGSAARATGDATAQAAAHAEGYAKPQACLSDEAGSGAPDEGPCGGSAIARFGPSPLGRRKRLRAQARGAAVVGWIRPVRPGGTNQGSAGSQPSTPGVGAQEAEPAVFVNRLGRGWAVLVTDPLEWHLAVTPGVYRDDGSHRIYRLAGRLAGLDTRWQADHPDVEVGELVPGTRGDPGVAEPCLGNGGRAAVGESVPGNGSGAAVAEPVADHAGGPAVAEPVADHAGGPAVAEPVADHAGGAASEGTLGGIYLVVVNHHPEPLTVTLQAALPASPPEAALTPSPFQDRPAGQHGPGSEGPGGLPESGPVAAHDAPATLVSPPLKVSSGCSGEAGAVALTDVESGTRVPCEPSGPGRWRSHPIPLEPGGWRVFRVGGGSGSGWAR